MKIAKYLFFLFLINIGQVIAQKSSPANMTAEQVAELSQTYHERALWFRDMPQFNRDSTVYYFHLAVEVLESHPPLQYRRLAEVFLDITDRQNRSHPFIVVDSLAEKGWQYYQQVPPSARDRLLEYGLLSNRASIKVEKGDLNEAIELFSSALSLIEDDYRPEVRARYLMDKGRFMLRYDLPEDEMSAYRLLKESMRYIHDMPQPDRNEYELRNLMMLSSYYEKYAQDSILYAYDQIKTLVANSKNPFKHAWYHAVWANYLIEQAQLDDAFAELLIAKALLEKYQMQNVDSYPYTLGLLGDIALEKGDYDLAISYYEQNREISLANSFKYRAMGMLSLIATAYEMKGDFQQALVHTKLRMEEALKFEKERAERSLREGELEMNVLKGERELEDKKNQQKFFLFALIVGLVLFVLLYHNYRLKKRANQQLESLNAELAIKNTLLDQRIADNELLLKEIHHRVKNNLEVVSSLLSLQTAKINDPNVQEAIQSSQNRVQSMGIIHQKLYQGEQLASIEMRDYFSNLSESILDSFDATGKVKVNCSMPELILDIDTAISVGLITNELLTNALKYAFIGKDSGEISVSLTRPDDNSYLLRVADNGIGKNADEIAKGTGFGTQLIQLLTRQLNGKLKYQINNGTIVMIDF